MPSVIGEQKFLTAIKQPKIIQGDIKDLENVLKLVMIKVGLRAANIPDEVEKGVLIHHIIENYGNHTVDEIRLAFDMAISGKLDLEQKDVICYENFSCLYFSSIINAYRKWARQTHQELKTEQPKELPAPKMTERERKEWIEEWKTMKGMPLALIPVSFYDYLKLTDYESYLERAMEVTKQGLQFEQDNQTGRIRLSEFNRQEKEGFEGEFKTLLINTAKRMAIYNQLKK